jgi:hypothetical protein
MDRRLESKGYGFFYDWLEKKWLPCQRSRAQVLSPQEQNQRSRRARLLRDLLTEMQAGGDSVSRLYVGLLARSLLSADEELMRAFGKEVAECCEGTRPATDAFELPVRNERRSRCA